jgi:hypothetical protein
MKADDANEACKIGQALLSARIQERSNYWKIKLVALRIFSIRKSPIWADNFPLMALAAIYISAIFAAHSLFGIQGKIVLKFYYDWFTKAVIVFSAFFFLYHIYRKSYKNYLSLRSWIGFLVVFILIPLFSSAFASYKQTIPLINSFKWDGMLMRWDYILHFGHYPWRLLEPILSHPILLRIIDLIYVLWFAVFFLFCFRMAWTEKRQLRLCFFISTILVWSLLGSVFGTIFSSAGPCYYSRVVSETADPFAPLMHRLSDIHQQSSLWALSNQFGLWEAQIYGTWLPFGGISAMPSIHLAMATLFALVAFNVHKIFGMVFIAYVAVIQIGSVILGWHYALDGYVAIILSTLIWFTVRRILKNRSA